MLFHSDAVRERIAQDITSGRACDVLTTPALFVNGMRLNTDPDLDEVFNLVDNQMNSNTEPSLLLPFMGL